MQIGAGSHRQLLNLLECASVNSVAPIPITEHSPHKPDIESLFMDAKDYFSSEEIISILRELGVNDARIVNDYVDLNSELCQIECSLGALEFRCYLIGSDPLFVGMLLATSIYCVVLNPFEFADELNSRTLGLTVEVGRDDSGEVQRDDDGDPLFIANSAIHFDGGVTSEHVRRRLAFWLDDVVEIFQIDELDDEVINPDIALEGIGEMGITEQIAWILGTDSIARSARQLATFLMKEKHEVNSALYRSADKFKSDGGQPPRWTLCGEGD